MKPVSENNTFSQSVKSQDKDINKISLMNAESKKQIDTSFISLKKQQNQLLLKSSLELSVSSGNQPLELLYRTAIEGINQVLENQLGEQAIQNTFESGLDVTPEATADRIVKMSTRFFSQYKDQKPKLSEIEAIDSFSNVISAGIDTGFSEARTILKGLDVLDNEIASNIDRTYQLVQQGLQKFVEDVSLHGAES